MARRELGLDFNPGGWQFWERKGRFSMGGEKAREPKVHFNIGGGKVRSGQSAGAP